MAIASMTDENGNYLPFSTWLKNQKEMGADAPRPTVREALGAMAAEQRGRELAKQAAADRERERLAALPQRPLNAFQAILDKGLHPSMEHRRKDLERQAKARKREIDAELAAQAERERIANDPNVKLAIENAGYVLAAAPTAELKDRAAENLAIANEGDTALYWARCRELETDIWAYEDAQMQSKLDALEASEAEVTTQAERLAASAKRMSAGEPPASQ